MNPVSRPLWPNDVPTPKRVRDRWSYRAPWIRRRQSAPVQTEIREGHWLNFLSSTPIRIPSFPSPGPSLYARGGFTVARLAVHGTRGADDSAWPRPPTGQFGNSHSRPRRHSWRRSPQVLAPCKVGLSADQNLDGSWAGGRTADITCRRYVPALCRARLTGSLSAFSYWSKEQRAYLRLARRFGSRDGNAIDCLAFVCCWLSNPQSVLPKLRGRRRLWPKKGLKVRGRGRRHAPHWSDTRPPGSDSRLGKTAARSR